MSNIFFRRYVIGLFFTELKNLDLSGSLSSEKFSKLSIYSCGYTPFCFTNSNKSPLNSCDKYLKSLPDRFLTNFCTRVHKLHAVSKY